MSSHPTFATCRTRRLCGDPRHDDHDVHLAPMTGLRMNIAAMVGSMLRGGWTAGLMIHFVNGSVTFPAIYAYALYPRLPQKSTERAFLTKHSRTLRLSALSDGRDPRPAGIQGLPKVLATDRSLAVPCGASEPPEFLRMSGVPSHLGGFAALATATDRRLTDIRFSPASGAPEFVTPVNPVFERDSLGRQPDMARIAVARARRPFLSRDGTCRRFRARADVILADHTGAVVALCLTMSQRCSDQHFTRRLQNTAEVWLLGFDQKTSLRFRQVFSPRWTPKTGN